MLHPGSARSLRMRFETRELVRLGQKEPSLVGLVVALLSPEKSFRTAVNPSVADSLLVESLLLAVPA